MIPGKQKKKGETLSLTRYYCVILTDPASVCYNHEFTPVQWASIKALTPHMTYFRSL